MARRIPIRHIRGRHKPLTVGEVAPRVIVQEGGEIYRLPVNIGFGLPNAIDQARGVEFPGDPEVRMSERVMVSVVHKGLQPANLAQWVRTQVKRKGGTRQLAETLAAQEHDPRHRSTEVRNLQRKLQEYMQTKGDKTGKYKQLGPLNARRVMRLVLAEATTVGLGVTGWWDMEQKGDIFRRFNSQPEDMESVRDVLGSVSGEGFIDIAETAAVRLVPAYSPKLVRLHGLHVEVVK